MIRLLEIWVILGNYTGKVKSRKSNISVHFWHLSKRRKCVDCRKIPVISGTIYRNFRPYLEPFWPFLEPKLTIYVKNSGIFLTFLTLDSIYIKIMSKMSKVYRNFRHMSKFSIILVVSERISRKSKAKQRRLSFGRFSTVETIRLSTFDFRLSRNSEIFCQTHGLNVH